jgi:DNA-binding CsgD family transcriptional regulator
MVNSENRGPFALWQLALYIAVLGLISMLLAPLSSLWWIVPLLGAAIPIVLAIIQGRQTTVPDKAAPVAEPLAVREMAGDETRHVKAGEASHREVVARGQPELANPDPFVPPGVALSEREMDVLMALASGKTNTEVAADLYISVGTVKSHSANIYRKLEAKNRTEAVARARELGLLP